MNTVLTNRCMKTLAKGVLAKDSPLYNSYNKVIAANLCSGSVRRLCCKSITIHVPTEIDFII